MKTQILLTLCIFFAVVSCKKDVDSLPVVITPPTVSSINDPLLSGKWYLDSTVSPNADVVYYERLCGPSSSVSYLKFTSSTITDYNCIFGSEVTFENGYKTNSGFIVSEYDTMRYHFTGNVLIISESYELSDIPNDSIVSWYSR